MVSIHALLAESDYQRVIQVFEFYAFQSTPSLRRATGFVNANQLIGKFQSTPSLRRATVILPPCFN